jgi:hypothetical protein
MDSPSRLMSGLCHLVPWPGDKRQLLAGDHVINLSNIPQNQGPRGGVMNDGHERVGQMRRETSQLDNRPPPFPTRQTINNRNLNLPRLAFPDPLDFWLRTDATV